MTMGELHAKHEAQEASRATKTAAAAAPTATTKPALERAAEPVPVPAAKIQLDVEKPEKKNEAQAALPRTRGTKRTR